MKSKLTIIITAFLISLSLAVPALARSKNETAFERVNRTGTIRCGYFTWAPFLMIDPNTKQFSGIYYDIIEEIGKQLKLEIEWVEETGQSNPFEGLRTGRFDMFCGPITPTPDRSKQVGFSRSFFYIPYLAYARIDDTRYADIASINRPEAKIAVIDGEFAYEIVKRDFPSASLLTLPALSDSSELMISVLTKKADLFLNDSAAAAVMIEKNPGKVRAVSKEPLRTLAAVIVLPQNDLAFKTMVDTVLDQLIGDRFIESVLAKYAKGESNFLPVAKPYSVRD